MAACQQTPQLQSTPMNLFDRLARIETLLRNRGSMTPQALREELECSRATLNRDLARLRDQANLPIVFDAGTGRYRLGAATIGPVHATPGLWFTESELVALLTLQALLADLDRGGVLDKLVAPMRNRIESLLATKATDTRPLMERIRIVAAARRPVSTRHFDRVCEALLRQRRLRIDYLSRHRNGTTERDVSPQRLTWYRNTWYLDAWCHLRRRMLRFSLDAMRSVEALDAAARVIPLRRVALVMDAGYGAFAGGRAEQVTLRFSPAAARWVSREEWHPQQRGSLLEDGSYRLVVPYTDPAELAMDVMRHGGEVLIENDSGTLAALVRDRTRRAWEQVAGSQPIIAPGDASLPPSSEPPIEPPREHHATKAPQRSAAKPRSTSGQRSSSNQRPPTRPRSR